MMQMQTRGVEHDARVRQCTAAHSRGLAGKSSSERGNVFLFKLAMSYYSEVRKMLHVINVCNCVSPNQFGPGAAA